MLLQKMLPLNALIYELCICNNICSCHKILIYQQNPLLSLEFSLPYNYMQSILQKQYKSQFPYPHPNVCPIQKDRSF